MLNLDTARKIGINACIDKLGRDFVLAHRNSSTSAYGESEDGLFCFVGVDDSSGDVQEQEDTLVLDRRVAFPYRASCTVDLATGTLCFVECVLPD